MFRRAGPSSLLRLDRQFSHADPRGLDGDDCTAAQCSADKVEDGEDDLRALAGSASGAAEQDHTGLDCSAEGEQGAEVGVGGDQDAAVLVGRSEDRLVGCAAQPYICNVHGVVAVVDKQFGDVALQGLIDQESHAEAGSGNVA